MDVHRLRRCSRGYGFGAPRRDISHLQPVGESHHHDRLSRTSGPL